MKKNKFNAKKTEYNGEVYDSKKEASYAHLLDILKRSKDPKDKVVSYRRQVPFVAVVNGKKICTYILDFIVWYADERLEHIDVKGMKSGSAYQMFRLKKKLIEALFSIEILER